MTTANDDAKWTALMAPFKDDEIELLPKFTGKMVDGKVPQDAKRQCAECGGYHGFPCVHLSYVGHAGLTMRLNEVCGAAGWDWEPMGITDLGTPVMADGGMWIRMNILGVTKIGFGDAQGKTGPNATKEMIGDALRNAAMRFGIGTYLWGKSDKAKAELVRQGVDDESPASAPTHGSSGTEPTAAKPEGLASKKQVSAVFGKAKALGWDNDALFAYIAEKAGKEVHPEQLTAKSARALLDALQKLLDESEVPAKPDGEVLDMTGDEIPF